MDCILKPQDESWYYTINFMQDLRRTLKVCKVELWCTHTLSENSWCEWAICLRGSSEIFLVLHYGLVKFTQACPLFIYILKHCWARFGDFFFFLFSQFRWYTVINGGNFRRKGLTSVKISITLLRGFSDRSDLSQTNWIYMISFENISRIFSASKKEETSKLLSAFCCHFFKRFQSSHTFLGTLNT